MKIIRNVTCTGTVNHRDAYFKASLCSDGLVRVLIFAAALRNPEDEVVDVAKVKLILDGRIRKRFEKVTDGKRIEKFTKLILVTREISNLFSKKVMEVMLDQFKRVCERELAEELGLKWSPPEGSIVKELSAEVKTDGPGILDLSDAINKGRETTPSDSTPSEA